MKVHRSTCVALLMACSCRLQGTFRCKGKCFNVSALTWLVVMCG